jgi:hypothetical protein
LGREIARRGLELVYGGADVGLMGELACTALAAGGRVIGVLPRHLARSGIAACDRIELHVVDSMHQRKALMAELADGFIALPGGLGTLEELLEALTWNQLGLHAKPCGLLNVNGYFQPLLAFFDQIVTQGFMQKTHCDLLLTNRDSAALLDEMAAFRIPAIDKVAWIRERNLPRRCDP